MPATGNKSYRPLTLSIRIFADGFSFFVCDPQSSSLVRGEHFQLAEDNLAERLQRELGRSDYYNRQIDQVYVLVCSPSLHVPLEEFHRDEAAAFYAFSFADQDMSRLRVAYTIQPELESVGVYAIDRDLEDVILQYYPTARFFASQAMLLERLMRYEQDADSHHRRLHVCLSTEDIVVVAFKDGRLHFANTFTCRTDTDRQYFALNVWQMLGYDAEQDHLVLLADDSALQSKAQQPNSLQPGSLQSAFALYVRHVDLLTSADLFSRVPLAQEKEVPMDLKALLLNRL